MVMAIVLATLGVMSSYTVVLLIIGFLFKAKKFNPTDKKYKYAVLIAARNEEVVVGNLIDSIRKQDYPSKFIEIFVIAHNCTDKTAQSAREAGAVVYELSNTSPKQHRKSYALDFALQNIKKDYATAAQPNGIKNFDGFFVFDADNLIATDYITEMNKAFDVPKYDFFSSYLSDKNIKTRFIPSYAAMSLYSVSLNQSRPLGLLGCSPRIRGRGMLFRNELLKEGWKWNTLLEDGEAGLVFMSRGIRGTHVEAAELFDECPHTFKDFTRQRLRWARGAWAVFFQRYHQILFGIIWPRRLKRDPDAVPPYKYVPQGKNRFTRGCKKFGWYFLDGLQKRFSCYNRAMSIFPRATITLIYGFLYPLGMAIYISATGDIAGLKMAVILVSSFYGAVYLSAFWNNLATIVRESKRIRCNTLRLFTYTFFWPFIQMYLEYLKLYALFVPIKWKVIPHIQSSQIEEVADRQTLASKFIDFVGEMEAENGKLGSS